MRIELCDINAIPRSGTTKLPLHMRQETVRGEGE